MNPVAMGGTASSVVVRRVAVDRAWHWLAAGWDDLARARGVALAYGGLIVILSLALTFLLFSLEWIYLLLPLAAGFFLIAPILAVGLYETSRRLASGEPVTLGAALGAWRRNGGQILLMGLLLMLINLAWVRIATLLFALFHAGGANPPLEALIAWTLFSPAGLPFLVVGTITGGLLAVVTFAIGAISIPMLLDRDVDVITAVATSVAAVRANWQAMALWAGLIVVFTAFGIATLYLGLAIALPLIGHATWHAYKDLVA